MAHTTSEPYDHYFVCCRTKKREFTCSEFLPYVEGLEIALQQMVEHDFLLVLEEDMLVVFAAF
eukprot:13483545-Ditylum_brightwellii.AAC.1